MARTVEIEGREFHNSSSNYSLPGDSAEHRRLGVQHRALKFMAGGNCLAPIVQQLKTKPCRVVDLCCGSGHWVIDMASDYPLAEVFGLDIVTPKPGIPLPENCKFIIGDVKGRLPFGDASYDLVQMRTVPSVPDRTEILKEIGRILRPGGYVTFIEPFEVYSEALGARPPALIEVDRLLALSPHTPRAKEEEGGQKKSWSVAKILVRFLEEAKDQKNNKLFDWIESKWFHLPVGSWPEDPTQAGIGAWMGEVQINLVGGFRPIFVTGNLISAEEFENLKKLVRDEVNDHSLKLRSPFMYVWAKRI
ncbi:S-adenosyl-L-methionine-dependent methyltransferase [Pluteus cervinus]|uniref:S-adenosyl-L-methionine-dependent methyltransferase n=1 Tax=Pluteus cervinus TaxID=181527 RepID=A0ACD3AQ88_9AGAR|nr:S-adenosyl-L-methionine-dependent methyltransferase [Pluteus cervinus]